MSLVTSNSTSLQTRAFIFKSVFTVFLYLPESFENPLDALAKTEVNQACQEPSPWHLPRTLLLTLLSVATETVTVRLLQGSQPGILSSGLWSFTPSKHTQHHLDLLPKQGQPLQMLNLRSCHDPPSPCSWQRRSGSSSCSSGLPTSPRMMWLQNRNSNSSGQPVTLTFYRESMTQEIFPIWTQTCCS